MQGLGKEKTDPRHSSFLFSLQQFEK